MHGITSENAPSPSVVISHFIAGGLFFFTATLLMAFFPNAFTEHYFNFKLLSITHLFVLGWITMVIFGALYQLIPVIMETKLFSELLAKISFYCLVFGASSLSISFWNSWLATGLHISATILSLAILCFMLNVLITAIKAEKKSIESRFIITSVIWLLFTAIAGILLAINLTKPFLSTPHLELLKLHAHAGIIGWFLQLIMGVGSRLLPMFMVAHQLHRKSQNIAYFALNIGLILGVLALFFQIKWAIFMAIIIVMIGILSFLYFLYNAYHHRIKKQLDIGMKQSAIAFIMLCLPLLFALTFFVEYPTIKQFAIPISIAYITALIIGVVSTLVMGQTYKTLPFIVWLKVYRSRIGKGKNPFPKDLYDEKIAIFQTWGFTLSFGIFLIGIISQYILVLQIGSIGMALVVLMYNINLFKIIFHKPITNEKIDE